MLINIIKVSRKLGINPAKEQRTELEYEQNWTWTDLEYEQNRTWPVLQNCSKQLFLYLYFV